MINQIANQIVRLLDDSRELISGPASELIYETAEMPVEKAGGRTLRVTADFGGQLVDVDLAMNFTVRGACEYED
ncbi:hypothetical protein [Streptomyces kronopolitis]|uniref:hypothetical protein n=1 Tax=Streptomyces kronopolitis TaxID=1612435 RepID=UPI00342FE129